MKKLIILILILTLIFTSACSFFQQDDAEEAIEPNDNTKEKEDIPEEPVYTSFSVFSGKGMIEDKDTYQAVGIMIENTEAARPHSALGLADTVYEIPVETYTITRFMAIYGDQHPTKIGPVRSARIPFVRMVQEWGLPYAHFGSAAQGQGDAKGLIESINIPMRFDGHQGINDDFYFRDNSRRAPHNAYFNGEAALTMLPSLEYEAHFNFDETTNVNQEDISQLSLRYSSSNQVKYDYDSENRNYLRFINDGPMMDTYIDDQIRVSNIIVQHAPHSMVEAASYILVDFLGQGKAEYFVDGKYEEGTWEKSSHEAKTEFFDKYGNPITLLPGNTWIQVVHNNVEINME